CGKNQFSIQEEIPMSQRKYATHRRAFRALILRILSVSVLMAPVFAQEAHEHGAPAKLVEDVRDATHQFLDVNAAGPAGYEPAFGCVSGPDHGAMGIHYVNGSLVGDGEVDVAHPEALIYEPVGGKRRLVGVEYIVDAATWL